MAVRSQAKVCGCRISLRHVGCTSALSVTQKRRCSCGMRLEAPYKCYMPLPLFRFSWTTGHCIPGCDEAKPRDAVDDTEQPQYDDDSLSTADGTHGLRAHRVTYGDVSLDGERRDWQRWDVDAEVLREYLQRRNTAGSDWKHTSHTQRMKRQPPRSRTGARLRATNQDELDRPVPQPLYYYYYYYYYLLRHKAATT